MDTPHTQGARAAGVPSPFSALLARWFIQYNPLFTASALCVLGGVWVLARGQEHADVELTLVLDAYQWLLIGSAAWLYRRMNRRRPAVFLAVIQLAYLVDPTLQVPALASAGHVVVTIGWGVSAVLKVIALGSVFRLRLSAGVYRLVALGAVLVVGLAHARVGHVVPEHALAAVLAVVAFSLFHVLRASDVRVEIGEALEGFPATVFGRVVRAARFAWVGALVFHAWNATYALGASALAPAAGALLMAWGVREPREGTMWRAWLGATVLGAIGGPLGHGTVMLLAAGSLASTSAGRAPRVLVMASMLAYVGGPIVARTGFQLLMEPAWMLTGVTLALLACALSRRAWSAIPVLCWLHVNNALERGWLRGPGSDAELGIVLVGAGFVLLPLGLWLHGAVDWDRVLRAGDDGGERRTDAGETSVAALSRA